MYEGYPRVYTPRSGGCVQGSNRGSKGVIWPCTYGPSSTVALVCTQVVVRWSSGGQKGYLGVYPQMGIWGYLGSYGHMGVSGDVPQMTPGYRGLRGVKASIASRGYLGLFEACIGPIWRVSTGGAPEGHLGGILATYPQMGGILATYPKWGYLGMYPRMTLDTGV